MSELADHELPYRKTLRLVGTVFILYGFVDAGMMGYCVSRQMSYMSSYNVFAVIIGLMLRRGSLPMAQFAAWFNAFFAGGTLGVLPLLPFLVPFGLLAAFFRQMPFDALVGCLFTAITFWFLIWTQWRLASPPVKDAYPKSPPRLFWKSLPGLTGVIAGIALGMWIVFLLKSHTAEDAIRRAHAKMGPGYSYVVTGMFSYGDRDGPYTAQVIAYNNNELLRLSVRGIVDDRRPDEALPDAE